MKKKDIFRNETEIINSNPSENPTEEISRRTFLSETIATAGVIALGSVGCGSKCSASGDSGDSDASGISVDSNNADTTRVIDIHRHYSSAIHNIDDQIQVTDEAGVTLSLLSFSMGLEMFGAMVADDKMDQWTRDWNDEYAETVQKYPSKLAFMAMVNPFSKNSIAECERCINDLGAKGINIGTSWRGDFLDSETLEPLWEYAESKEIPIYIHPPNKPIGYEQIVENRYDLWESIGRPFDTVVSVSSLFCCGVFDRYKNLQLVLPHMGGGIINLISRLDFRYELGYPLFGDVVSVKAVCKEKPSSYLKKNINVDIMGFSAPGIKQCIEVLGVDRVFFGSDYPFVDVSPKAHIDIVKDLGLSRDDQDKIFWKNATNLFKLT